MTGSKLARNQGPLLGVGVLAAGLGLLVTACDPSQCPPCSNRDGGHPPAGDCGSPPDQQVAADGGSRRNYQIELTGTHGQIYKTVALLWTVRDLGDCTSSKDTTTCKLVSGLPVVAFSRVPGGAVVEQKLETGKLEDNGDGTYTQTRTFGWFGSYAVGLKFVKDGQLHFGVFPYDTSRGGGEKYFCDADKDGTDETALMIRWNASQESVVADDSTEYSFGLELTRSFNTPINTTEPWKNSFDPLLSKQLTGGLPTVRLMADKGTGATSVATLTPVYKGKGIYEVKRKFAAADLGSLTERTFWLEVSFTDELGCAPKGSADPDEYYFPVKK